MPAWIEMTHVDFQDATGVVAQLVREERNQAAVLQILRISRMIFAVLSSSLFIEVETQNGVMLLLPGIVAEINNA